MVVLPSGCPSYLLASDPTCVQDRGQTFDNTSSSTWDVHGLYSLSFFEANLGLDAVALFANDTITLGIEGSGGPTLKNQIVAGVASGTYWLGLFGLNPQPTNYTSLSDSQASYMSNLKEQNLIPSLSFGYTAGAPYRMWPALSDNLLTNTTMKVRRESLAVLRLADTISVGSRLTTFHSHLPLIALVTSSSEYSPSLPSTRMVPAMIYFLQEEYYHLLTRQFHIYICHSTPVELSRKLLVLPMITSANYILSLVHYIQPLSNRTLA